jgi:ATP-dependent protease ClpP protease subunit
MECVTLHGPVGESGFSIRQLQDLPNAPLRVRIDSAGGDITSGLAAYQLLRSHRHPVITEIHRAGSAAVLAALAGDHREIHGAAWIFLHDCWTCSIGPRRAMLQAAAEMRRQDRLTASITAQRTGQPLRLIRQLRAAETTLSSVEAVRLGFAHTVIGAAVPPPAGATPERTALAILAFQQRAHDPERIELRQQAEPAALAVPGAPGVVGIPAQLPTPAREDPAEYLARFAEARRRDRTIRRRIRSRIQQAMNCGVGITWPLRVSWTCARCRTENHHAPVTAAGFSTPCATCGAYHNGG